MNRLHRLLRHHSRLLSAVALVAALAVVGLDAILVLHHVAEDACPARETGDPFDCYVCTALLRIGLELPSIATVPAPQPGELLTPPAAATLPVARALCFALARSPPVVLL